MSGRGPRDDRGLGERRGVAPSRATRRGSSVVVPDAAMVDELVGAIAAVGGRTNVTVSSDVVQASIEAAARGPVGLLVTDEAAAAGLPRIAVSRAAGTAVALVARHLARHRDVEIAGDAGIVIVRGVGALAAALTLLEQGVERPWLASVTGLGPHDQARLEGIEGGGAEGRFARQGPHIALARRGKPMSPAIPLGDAESVIEAVLALRDAAAFESRGVEPGLVENADAALEVLFGPARALSDPASKAALAPYALPFPRELMCGSPSAAASAASRLGFPARLSLASPDLRFTEHPDLAIDGVRHASGARDAYRELMLRAELLSPSARVLGATVSRSAVVTAKLSVCARMHDAGFAVAHVTFADDHGRAAQDGTWVRLPASTAMVRRALDRLAGAALLGRIEEPLSDVLSRTGAFVRDRAREVSEVWLDPVVRLADGRAEVWGARVVVGDAFARALGD